MVHQELQEVSAGYLSLLGVLHEHWWLMDPWDLPLVSLSDLLDVSAGCLLGWGLLHRAGMSSTMAIITYLPNVGVACTGMGVTTLRAGLVGCS